MANKNHKDKIVIFWFRRDLRLHDNAGLSRALSSGLPVLPIFIFDENILDSLPKDDARVSFIYDNLMSLNSKLQKLGSSIKILKGKPIDEFKKLIKEFDLHAVFSNKDYEPYARKRDQEIHDFLKNNGIQWLSTKDQVIFEEHEVLKNDGKPYTVFTPYKRKWLEHFDGSAIEEKSTTGIGRFYAVDFQVPSFLELGFTRSTIKVKEFNISQLGTYAAERNFPAIDSTSYLSPHLRFGTVSIRQIIRQLEPKNEVFLSELVWREFFMQILFHFPCVVYESFRKKYDNINWRNNEAEFENWCQGKTGYPMVDAGMRQLNQTGYMHNRVRMIVASFLCKHLLIDWRWGEAYFAQKLLDFELSSNNGNWQWAAGTGCDTAPYFRIFNPHEQLKKFDKDLIYVRKWVSEFDTFDYPQEMVDHKMARNRALERYKLGITDN